MKKKLFEIEVFEGDEPDTFSFTIKPMNNANEVQLAVFCNILYERCIKFVKGETDNLLKSLLR